MLVSRCQRAIRLFQPSFGQGTSHPKKSRRIIPLSAETRQLSGNGHPYPKMVMSNGSAKKRGRPGGQPKKKSEQRHPIDAGDDLERVRQPMRMEGASPCGWKRRLHADGRATPIATIIFEFLFARQREGEDSKEKRGEGEGEREGEPFCE